MAFPYHGHGSTHTVQKLEEMGYLLIPSEELIEYIGTAGFDPQFGARPMKRMIQKELLNPGFRRGRLSKQSDTYRTIAGTLETGKAQVIDPAMAGQVVFDEPPSPYGFGGGTKMVLRKPIDESEQNGKAKKEKASA